MIEAEIDRSSDTELQAYLQGALKDGTRSRKHGTHRIGQADRLWIELLQLILRRLKCSAWLYREGRTRRFWIVETTARFLSVTFDAAPLVGTSEGIHYARGYFDAEGGVPHDSSARLYVQLVQKNRASLEDLRAILRSADIGCGRLHIPSARVDPDLWRFYVRAASHQRFMRLVGSWHPRKRHLFESRLTGMRVTFRTSPALPGPPTSQEPRGGGRDFGTNDMSNKAFAILGIQPTDDGRIIRSAFLRLARIYHPDRFVDMPDDVRVEAERRMKEATIAYESLRTAKPADEPAPVVIDDAEIQRRAAKYREAADKKKKMDEFDRARWRSWEEAEKRARDKARMEADIATRLEHEMNGVPSDAKPTTEAPEPGALTAKKRSGKSRLNERIDAARRGETNPLVPQGGTGS